MYPIHTFNLNPPLSRNKKRCTGGFWGEKGSGSPSLDDKPIKMEDGTCGGEQSTDSCCGRYLPYNVERMAKCREDFKCTSDPCKVGILFCCYAFRGCVMILTA